jgi:hypothetical protein
MREDRTGRIPRLELEVSRRQWLEVRFLRCRHDVALGGVGVIQARDDVDGGLADEPLVHGLQEGHAIGLGRRRH